MVYCGEKALLGTLTRLRRRRAAPVLQRRTRLTPAPGFTMVYAQAHYAPGFGERYDESDPITTLTQARQRVSELLDAGPAARRRRLLRHRLRRRRRDRHPRADATGLTYGEVFKAGDGYAASTLDVTSPSRTSPAPRCGCSRPSSRDSTSATPTTGTPSPATPAARIGGGSGLPFTDIAGTPFVDEIVWLADTGITTGCAPTLFCPTDPVTRGQMATFLARALGPAGDARPTTSPTTTAPPTRTTSTASPRPASPPAAATPTSAPPTRSPRAQLASFLARALDLPATTTDYFTDDDGSVHEDAINRIADAGITTGCGAGRFCPDGIVIRQVLAAFLYRAFGA